MMLTNWLEDLEVGLRSIYRKIDDVLYHILKVDGFKGKSVRKGTHGVASV